MGVLLSMLDSPYPSLREIAVEQLFEYLNLTSDEVGAEGRGTRAVGLLTETPWSMGNEKEKITAAKGELTALLLP